MPRKLDVRKMYRILQVLSYNFAEPKRYSFIWDCVKEKREGTTRHIGTKKTLNLYLKRLEEERKIVKIEKSRKNISYALTKKKQDFWKDKKEKYEARMTKDIRKFQNDVRNMIYAVNVGEIGKERIENIVVNAWLFYITKSTEAFNLLVDAKQSVSFVADAYLKDWVLSPFMLSAKVVETCYKKYPEKTKKALNNLMNIFHKPLG